MVLPKEQNSLFFFSCALCCPPPSLTLFSHFPLISMGGMLRVAGGMFRVAGD